MDSLLLERFKKHKAATRRDKKRDEPCANYARTKRRQLTDISIDVLTVDWDRVGRRMEKALHTKQFKPTVNAWCFEARSVNLTIRSEVKREEEECNMLTLSLMNVVLVGIAGVRSSFCDNKELYLLTVFHSWVWLASHMWTGVCFAVIATSRIFIDFVACGTMLLTIISFPESDA